MQQQYVVLQVTLKEKLFGTGSGNLTELEKVINNQASKGYRLHTISTASAHSTGFAGGDRIQATMVFEKLQNTAPAFINRGNHLNNIIHLTGEPGGRCQLPEYK